jgi:hypothetical protein
MKLIVWRKYSMSSKFNASGVAYVGYRRSDVVNVLLDMSYLRSIPCQN